MRVKLREGAGALGLSAGQIASQLRAAYQGRVAGEIQVGAESYEIDVRLAEADRDALADLAYFHVTAPGGAQVPLDSVARVEPGRSWARIARIDGRRAVSVQGDVDTRLANTGQVIRWTEREFFPVLREEFPDVEASIEGEAKEGATTGASMRRAFAIGLIGVFLLLSFQFKSYVEPLIVMVAIPFAFVGVVAGHWVMGLPLSLPSLMGFVSLSGVVVNDSILLVEFVKIHRRRGAAIVEAAARASRERFRAVLLTSLTTIFGLLPLLAERSLQAQILVPLAASIVFGLMASTVLVLIVIPALYAALGDFGLAARVEVEEAERAAS
jgi:multidrug efflux pump subunit AcrB